MTASDADVVRTRFAPSPTGYLHIGGARTALFNYLLARRLGGKFILRIEDTDQSRNIPSADEKLMDDLRWLGLCWDEGPLVGGIADLPPEVASGPWPLPVFADIAGTAATRALPQPGRGYYQSARLPSYHEHARRLLEEGKAYYAFDTPEELEAMRQAARREGRNFRYPRPARFPSESQAQEARQAGRPVVIRFCTPQRDYVVHDRILGDVRLAAGEMDDFVILKSDGWPTYHFAVVVDDQAMRVTHVLRGQEHLINTPRHLALQEAFGFPTPVYAHLPIILNMDGTKMSKREKDRAVRAAVEAALRAGLHPEAQLREIAGVDAQRFALWRRGEAPLDGEALRRLARTLNVQLPEIEVHDFRVSGYLPEVLVNFIALLGWSSGEPRERFTLPELCQVFSIERIGRTNARFDRAKLLNFNTAALAAATPQRRLEALQDYIRVNPGSALSGLSDETLRRLIDLCEGYRISRDIEDKCAALFVPDEALTWDPGAVHKALLSEDGQGLALLREVRGRLAATAQWTAAEIERVIRGLARERDLGLGAVAQPLRVAVTGRMISPPIFDTLELLGRERTLRRIDRALATIGAAQPPHPAGS